MELLTPKYLTEEIAKKAVETVLNAVMTKSSVITSYSIHYTKLYEDGD